MFVIRKKIGEKEIVFLFIATYALIPNDFFLEQI
jgi:hypothetical protein